MVKSILFTQVEVLTDLPLTFLRCLITFPDPEKKEIRGVILNICLWPFSALPGLRVHPSLYHQDHGITVFTVLRVSVSVTTAGVVASLGNLLLHG